MNNTLLFKITPQIKRYLDRLVSFSKKYPSGGHDCVLDTFEQGEEITEYSIKNISAFVKYMEEKGILKCHEISESVSPVDYSDDVLSDIKHKDDAYPKKWRACVLNKEMLKSIVEFANKGNDVKQGESRVKWNYITGELRYLGPGIKPKTFHKEKNRKMFNILWENKKHIILENVEFVGIPKKIIDIAYKLGFTQDSRLEEHNNNEIIQTLNLARDVIKSVRTKGFDISLTQTGGLLMTLKE